MRFDRRRNRPAAGLAEALSQRRTGPATPRPRGRSWSVCRPFKPALNVLKTTQLAGTPISLRTIQKCRVSRPVSDPHHL